MQERGSDRAPVRRQLIDHRIIKVPIQCQRKGARDGRCGHDEGIGPQAFLPELRALHDPEAVLFVDNDQPELPEQNVLLNERVRANNDHAVTGGYFGKVALLGTGGLEGNLDAERFCKLHDIQIVLLGQNLGRRHQGRLISAFHGIEHGHERNDCFAGADIALNQPVHRDRPRHVVSYFADNATLRSGKLKRQRLIEASGKCSLWSKRNAAFFLLMLLQGCQSDLEGKQFIKRKTVMRRGCRAVKIVEQCRRRRKVHCLCSLRLPEAHGAEASGRAGFS